MAVVVKTGPWDPISGGEFITHFRLPVLAVGLVDVHWGLTDLDFDPPGQDSVP